jgi:hypothetical protein
MIKNIAIGIGIGFAALSQAASMNERGEFAQWAGLTFSKVPVTVQVNLSKDEQIACMRKAQVMIAFESILRQLRQHVEELQIVKFAPMDLEIELAPLAEFETQFRELDMFVPNGTFAFVPAPPACPDRPEIPQWAWAWELSTPEGW